MASKKLNAVCLMFVTFEETHKSSNNNNFILTGLPKRQAKIELPEKKKYTSKTTWWCKYIVKKSICILVSIKVRASWWWLFVFFYLLLLVLDLDVMKILSFCRKKLFPSSPHSHIHKLKRGLRVQREMKKESQVK